MKKTLIFLVVIFSLLLAACNQPTEAPPTPTEAVAAPTEAQPAAATAEPTQPSEAAATEPAATEPSAPAPAQPAPEVAKTLRLPDLGGAHGGSGHRQRLHPAQLRRPCQRQIRRLGIRRRQRNLPPPQLHRRLAGHCLGHHDLSRPGRSVRCRHGWHHHQRRAQAAS